MSAADERGAVLADVEDKLRRASHLANFAGVEASGQSIALTLAGLLALQIDDERRTWDASRDRDRAFAAELNRLAGPEGAAYAPRERTVRLRMLADWIRDAYDAPPTEDDYQQEVNR